MATPRRRVEHALLRCETDHAPDPRVTVFDVTADREREVLALSGAVLTAELKTRAAAAAERVTDAPVVADDLTVLEADAEERTITESVAPVRGDPDDDAEQVTQVLYGAAVTAYDSEGAWRRVRTPDGYVAWVESASLAESAPLDPDAVVSAGEVPFDPAGDCDGDDDGDERPETLCAGTDCEIVESGENGAEDDDGSDAERDVTVRFRTGARASLPADAVGSVTESTTGEDVVDAARRYLDTEYVWGGMTVEGIDCSGLTWQAYHRHGVDLPRDADVQRRMGEAVERAALAPGDLLFFPGHVALSLGGEDILHAEGDAGEVVVDSLDPEAERYNERLDEEFESARRLL